MFGKAFMVAYQQAVHNAKAGGGAAATAAKQAKAQLKPVMSVSESLSILNITTPPPVTMQQIALNYKKHFDANAVDKGGSFYLQSKIFRAKECLELSLKQPDFENDFKEGKEDKVEEEKK